MGASPTDIVANSINASSRWELYFQALSSRFCRTVPIRVGSASAQTGCWMTKRTRRSGPLEFLGDLVGLGTQIDCLKVDLGPRDARKVKQGVDKLRHLRARGLDSPGVAPADLAESLKAVFHQGFAVA